MKRVRALLFTSIAALAACDSAPPPSPAASSSASVDEAARVLAEAEALRGKGDWEGVESLLIPWVSDPRPGVRGKVIGKLGRVARSRGEVDRAVNLLYEAIALDREAGDDAAEGADGLALAYTLMVSTRSLDEASDVLTFVGPAASRDPKIKAMAPYYEGLLAYETGDYGEALRLFRISRSLAVETNQARHRADTAQVEANLLVKLGRFAESEALFRDLMSPIPPDYGPCDRANLFTNVGFAALLTRRSMGETSAADPRATLEGAYRLYVTTCRDLDLVANALTNLALAAHARGDKESARRYLHDARAAEGGTDAKVTAYQLQVEAEQALGEGKEGLARAEALYETMGRLAAVTRLRAFAIEASLGKALVLEAKGARDEADNAYREARSSLGRWLDMVPLGEGWDTFLSTLSWVTARWVEALLKRPNGARDAFMAAGEGYAQERSALLGLSATEALTSEERAARRREVERYRRARESLEATLQGLSWATPSEELSAALGRYHEGLEALRLGSVPRIKAPLLAPGVRAPAPAQDEVQIVYAKLPRGWIGLAASADGVVKHDVSPSEPSALVKPFLGLFAGKKRITARALGALGAVDLHATPELGAPLVYRLGLDRAPRAPSSGAKVVMVIDPSGDYPAMAREAEIARRALEGRGLAVKALAGEAATRGAVLEALEDPSVDLFYYLGHAAFEGRDGERSALWLAGYGRLTVTDVLAARRVPLRVVLAGCEAGRSSAVGVAHAFVMAGAASVVAASRPVDAGFAARFVRGLAEEQGEDPFGDPAAAAARVGRSMRQKEPSSDWASFRVIVP